MTVPSDGRQPSEGIPLLQQQGLENASSSSETAAEPLRKELRAAQAAAGDTPSAPAKTTQPPDWNARPATGGESPFHSQQGISHCSSHSASLDEARGPHCGAQWDSWPFSDARQALVAVL
ncbi:hypothetical protein cyc_08432 [Cyclospora cayetanensis]|uniref:Uncharacterized protein n=1 Tax=Cyclospora cayetanensis TaxID=88456 RepID=A0A1D3CUK2_9EIME|nr:hypothetical protein cyc_08432 [Cyclospora cayetanensis]